LPKQEQRQIICCGLVFDLYQPEQRRMFIQKSWGNVAQGCVMGCSDNDGWLPRKPNHQISRRLFGLPPFLLAALTAIIAGLALGGIQPAEALPSFARQTGQPCGACHTDYPGLTPFGRQFKLGGYTLGGGKFRTTLFPTQTDTTNALASYAKKTSTEKNSDQTKTGEPDTSNVWVPPISMMAIVGYTNTQKDQSMLSPYHSNNNVVVSPLSFFYGGAITEHIGLFSQVTFGNAPPGGSAIDPTTGAPVTVTDPCWNCEWSWDNTDLRYANTGKLGDMDIVYGITANNNPTVQDPWNTTPAWGFPYSGSTVAPGPAAATLIDGTYAQFVGGAGAYTFIDNLVYLELTAYRTLDFKTLPKLGVDPFGVPQFQGVAPYWRVAVEPHWGNHWLEFGAFGMFARVHPWTGADTNGDGTGFLINQSFPQTDRYNDVAFDTQYQYQGDDYWITLRGTYIHEKQTLGASFANGLSSNPTNTLNTLKMYASLAYGSDNRIVLTGQYFDTWGTSDPTLYGGLASGLSPNSNGYIAEIAYIPFINSNSPIWPWANARVGLQYTYYNKFDGTSVNAHDNNTLFMYAWFAM
jgi:hypothetical protein